MIMENEMGSYSFLTSCYIKSKPDEFKVAMESMLNQTLPPEQIVLVVDGQIGDYLNQLIDEYTNNFENIITVVRLEQNVGQGLAIREGTQYCRNELIARMDMDDICELNRCEKELNFLDSNPDIDIVGSNITEFIDSTDNIVGIRKVCEKHDDICKYMKSRCPFNQMTVVVRKTALEKAGGYMHWWLNEDSYLWARMYLAGCKFHNIQENLVKVRVGKEMYARRGGYKYYKSERDLYKFMYKNKIINWFQYQKNKFIRFVVQVLMPNNIRQWFFKKFARSN